MGRDESGTLARQRKNRSEHLDPSHLRPLAGAYALAWTPAHSMPRTGLGGHAEHFVVWLGTATIIGLASRTTAPRARPLLLLMLYAAILEYGQLYAPGRQPSFHDFAFSAGGVLLGSALVWTAHRCWLRSGSRPAR
jgi:VanZ family protein